MYRRTRARSPHPQTTLRSLQWSDSSRGVTIHSTNSERHGEICGQVGKPVDEPLPHPEVFGLRGDSYRTCTQPGRIVITTVNSVRSVSSGSPCHHWAAEDPGRPAPRRDVDVSGPGPGPDANVRSGMSPAQRSSASEHPAGGTASGQPRGLRPRGSHRRERLSRFKTRRTSENVTRSARPRPTRRSGHPAGRTTSSTLDRRSLDRRILSLAVPALGALVAEPLFVLVDSAMVGHLGATSLAGLSLASTVLTTVVGLFVFLAYATTATTARLLGAGLQPAHRRR